MADKKNFEIKGKWTVKVEMPIIIDDVLIPENVTFTGLCAKCNRIHNLSVPCELIGG
jgi:hypothetical protein